ncbi:MAG: DUF4384 domain-containing protein [Caldimicrobium sp.]|nr:DUF4384 domain-containing protein [Caldimicrobium sp.]
MKILIFITVLLLVFSNKAYTSSNEEVSARSLFMTTAGSTIDINKPKPVSLKTKPSSKYSTNLVKIPSGLSIEIVKLEGGKGIPVNPKKYQFKTGEEFIVKFQTNAPGIVKVYNMNPKGKITHLGTWIIKSGFLETKLPNEGAFKFVNTKGKEKLIFEFYPCKVEEQFAQYALARDIVLVDNKSQRTASYNEEFANYYPRCEKYKTQVEREVVSSRDIVLFSNADLVKFENGANYVISYTDNQNNNPIVAVIELQHK